MGVLPQPETRSMYIGANYVSRSPVLVRETIWLVVGCYGEKGEERRRGEGNRYYRLKPRSHTFLGSKNATLNLTSMTTANLLHAGQKSLQHFPPKYFAAFPPLLTGCFPQKRPREALQSRVSHFYTFFELSYTLLTTHAHGL